MKKIFSKIKFFIFSTLFIIFSFCAISQDVDVSAANPDFPQVVTVAGPNTPITIHSTGVSGNVFWGITGHNSVPGPSCPSSSASTETYDCNGVHVVIPVHSTDVGVPVSSGGHPENDGTISFPGPLTPGQIITITLTVTSASNPALTQPRNYVIKVVKPRDVMLVLDRSGSMSTITSGSTPPTSRWNALRTAVSLFMDQYESFHISGDRIGVTFFDTHADMPPPTAPFNTSFYNVTNSNAGDPNSSKNKVLSIIPGNPSSGSTAMGEGVLGGNGKFPNPLVNQPATLLFSDGIQNTGVMINYSTGSDGSPAGSLPGTHAGTTPINLTGGKIFTVGFDAPAEASALLGNIALNNGGGPNGYQNTQTGDASDIALANLFNNTIPNLLSGGSPQLVDVRRGVFGNSQKSIVETFTVNKSINKLFFEVVGLGYATISSVKHNGVEKISTGNVIHGQGYVAFADSLSNADSSQGDWQITAMPYYGELASAGNIQGSNYFVSATVDDHLVDYKCGSGNNSFKVGDTFKPSVQLQYIGRTIKNATIKAIILKPGDDLGDLLARSNINVDTSSGADLSVAEQKYQALLKDSTFLNKLKATNQVVNLTYRASDSTYSGDYQFNDISGVYQVIYMVDADDPVTGKVLRYNQQSIYVRFPDVNIDSSNAVLTATAQAGISTLTFRPITSTGRFVGPGWGNTIGLSGNSIQLTNMIDNGDGSYTLTISGDTTQNVILTIGGDTTYNGQLQNIGKGGNSNPIGGEIWKEWWFWLIVILILIIIIWSASKKKNP